MDDLRLTEEQLEIRDTVREFVANEVTPIALRSARLEAGERDLPVDVRNRAVRMGLRALTLSEAHGGAGADELTACIVAEELAVGEINLAATLACTWWLAKELFDFAMTAEQRERFLPVFLADDSFHLAFAAREPGGDYDVGVNYHSPAAMAPAVATTAVKRGNGWVIDGTKTRVTNAPVAKLIAVQAQTDGGVRVLLVPAGTPGLSVRPSNDAYAWHHGSSGEVIFRDCEVPATDLLAESGRLDAAAESRNIVQQALNLGVGRAAHEAAVNYTKLRVQGGRPIIQHQAIGTLLAEMAIRLQVARTMVWHTARATDHPERQRGLPDLPNQAIAKVFTSEAVHQVTLDAADCFGAPGVMRDLPMQKYVREALIFLHSGQSNGDAKLRIAEAVAGFRRS